MLYFSILNQGPQGIYAVLSMSGHVALVKLVRSYHPEMFPSAFSKKMGLSGSQPPLAPRVTLTSTCPLTTVNALLGQRLGKKNLIPSSRGGQHLREAEEPLSLVGVKTLGATHTVYSTSWIRITEFCTINSHKQTTLGMP